MQFVYRPEFGVPVGTYNVRVAGADPFTEKEDQYGPAVRVRWQVTEGPHIGAETSRICSAKMSAKSNLGKLTAQLKGGPIAPGETIDLTTFVGITGTAIVEQTETGSTRVASFMRADTSAPKPNSGVPTADVPPDHLGG